MASATSLIDDWMDSDEKESFYAKRARLVYRWINEAQLRHVDRSEILRSIWKPTITSSGKIVLPADFLREYQDHVLQTTGTTSSNILRKVDYQDAFLTDFSAVTYYSIYNGYFYVWAAAACTPEIPYVKKPAVIGTGAMEDSDLELPTETHSTLGLFLDAMWCRSKGDYTAYLTLLGQFERRAVMDGQKFAHRQFTTPKMR